MSEQNCCTPCDGPPSENGHHFECACDECCEEQIKDQSDQICPCSAACNPEDYEGRMMLYPDEAWHNWYFNKKEHPLTAGHREKCYDCMEYYLHSIEFGVSE